MMVKTPKTQAKGASMFVMKRASGRLLEADI